MAIASASAPGRDNGEADPPKPKIGSDHSVRPKIRWGIVPCTALADGEETAMVSSGTTCRGLAY